MKCLTKCFLDLVLSKTSTTLVTRCNADSCEFMNHYRTAENSYRIIMRINVGPVYRNADSIIMPEAINEQR